MPNAGCVEIFGSRSRGASPAEVGRIGRDLESARDGRNAEDWEGKMVGRREGREANVLGVLAWRLGRKDGDLPLERWVGNDFSGCAGDD